MLYTNHQEETSLLLEYPILFIFLWFVFAVLLYPFVIVAMCVYAALLGKGLAILKGIFWMVVITSALYLVAIIFQF